MSGQQDDKGLTLQGLAQRLEALERENERMRSENAELRDEVAALRGSGARQNEVAALRGSGTHGAAEKPTTDSDGRVSRSWLLSKAGAAAVGAVAAGGLLARDARVAKANHLDPGIFVNFVVTHNEGTNSTAVFGDAPNGEGVVGSGKVHGVRGTGLIGVRGSSSSNGSAGVYGQHTGTSGGYGVAGTGKGAPPFAGVFGRNSTGHGVRGEGQSGVVGVSSTAGFSGVSGLNTGQGYGVVGSGNGFANAGVLGRNPTGPGVRGEGPFAVWGTSSTNVHPGVYGENTVSGYGVQGDGLGPDYAGVRGRNPSGYGGYFQGGRAQLKLAPGSTAGKPSGAHTKGEIYMDSNGALFVCTVSGTPGTWRQVTTTTS